MSKEIASDGAQESLIITAPGTDEMFVRDFNLDEDEILAVSLPERRLHLLNTFRLFDQYSLRENFRAASHTEARGEIEQRFGRNTQAALDGAERNAQLILREARWEFARAYGLFEMSDDPQSAKEMIREDWGQFFDKFGSRWNTSAREIKKQQLKGEIKAAGDRVTTVNRVEGLRPHQPDADDAGEEEKLSTQQRLGALLEDPRAGFLPTTHTEKNMALVYLDYLDNPEFPLGIGNQLKEVDIHRSYQAEDSFEGELAMRSLTYQMKDFYGQALSQLASLRDLEVAIGDCPNPVISLTEDIGSDHPGFAPLVRFIDLSQRATTGKVVGFKRDNLRTNTDREGHDKQNKHKTVTDYYMATNPHTDFEIRTATVFREHVAKQVSKLKIGPMRTVVSEAITDQEKRIAFWEARLREITDLRERSFHAIAEIGRQALEASNAA